MEENEKKRLEAKAETYLWEHCRKQMEAAGQKSAADKLKDVVHAVPRSVSETGGFTTVEFEMYHKITDYSVLLNAADGALMGWHLDAFAHDSTREASPEFALDVAQAAGQPDTDATLSHAGYEDAGGQPVYVAHWDHLENGIPVEGDYLHVLVNGALSRAFAVYRKWRKINFEYTER